MKAAYLVLGPESSGTRFVTQLLIAAGCTGSSEHAQPFDAALPSPDIEPLIVLRRSYPHGDTWPIGGEIIYQLRQAGYAPRVVVCMRDWHAMVASQVRVGHAVDATSAVLAIRRAYDSIFISLDVSATPYWIASYDALVARPEQAPRKLAELIGLNLTQHLEIKDGNAQYY